MDGALIAEPKITRRAEQLFLMSSPAEQRPRDMKHLSPSGTGLTSRVCIAANTGKRPKENAPSFEGCVILVVVYGKVASG